MRGVAGHKGRGGVRAITAAPANIYSYCSVVDDNDDCYKSYREAFVFGLNEKCMNVARDAIFPLPFFRPLFLQVSVVFCLRILTIVAIAI